MTQSMSIMSKIASSKLSIVNTGVIFRNYKRYEFRKLGIKYLFEDNKRDRSAIDDQIFSQSTMQKWLLKN